MSPSKHGKGKQRRAGVHKNARSPETKIWNAEHLVPKRPGWMDEETWRQLAELRAKL